MDPFELYFPIKEQRSIYLQTRQPTALQQGIGTVQQGIGTVQQYYRKGTAISSEL